MIAAAQVRRTTDNDRALHQAAEFAKRRGIVVLFSDLFGDLETIVGGLDHLRYNNHEVIVFHVMDPWERDLSVDGHVRCRDLESGETLTTAGRRHPHGLPSSRGRLEAGARSRMPQARDRPHRADHRRRAGPGTSRLPCETGQDVLVPRSQPMAFSYCLAMFLSLVGQTAAGDAGHKTPAERLEFMKVSLKAHAVHPAKDPETTTNSKPSRSCGSPTRSARSRTERFSSGPALTIGPRSRCKSSCITTRTGTRSSRRCRRRQCPRTGPGTRTEVVSSSNPSRVHRSPQRPPSYGSARSAP